MTVFKPVNDMSSVTTVIRDPRERSYGDAATSFIGGNHVEEFGQQHPAEKSSTLARCN
jgi:hypothetical protein